MFENDYWDLVKDLKKHEIRFRLVPNHMTGYCSLTSLEWKGVPFSSKNYGAIPNKRGVYAFVIEWSETGLPPHGYIMYIGKAGDGGHSLRKRFRDYFQDQKRPKRPGIYRMLNYWGDVLKFYYAKIEDETIKLNDIERALNDALLPPYSKNDFSVRVRNALNAFES